MAFAIQGGATSMVRYASSRGLCVTNKNVPHWAWGLAVQTGPRLYTESRGSRRDLSSEPRNALVEGADGRSRRPEGADGVLGGGGRSRASSPRGREAVA
jgi:hypothetical protein